MTIIEFNVTFYHDLHSNDGYLLRQCYCNYVSL